METAALRILYIARSCVFPGMNAEFARRCEVFYCQANKRDRVPDGMKLLTYRAAWKLRTDLRTGRYDLVISCANTDPLWRADRNFFSNLLKLLKKIVLQPETLGTYLVPWMVRGSGVPLAIYDWDDNTIIARKCWPQLEAATCYFKTQSPRNPYKAFLFQDRRNDCVFNIVRQPRYRAWAPKLRSYCTGITIPDNWSRPPVSEKKTDVFFAGAIHYSWVRPEGLRLLEELREEGFNIDLHRTGPGLTSLPQEEFLRRCSQAWLVWSPEGAGWDCTRHYWAPLMGSVPLLNHPDTRRHHPHIDGVHAFYYGVEGDDLKRVVRLALADKDRLRRMATEGEALVRRHHTHAALADYMIAETLRTARAPREAQALNQA